MKDESFFAGEEGPSLVSGMDGAHLCIPLTKTKQLLIFPIQFLSSQTHANSSLPPQQSDDFSWDTQKGGNRLSFVSVPRRLQLSQLIPSNKYKI